jgi:hypothetical protein
MITFASDKSFGLTNRGPTRLAGNVVGGEKDSSSAVTPTIRETSFYGPSISEFTLSTSA